MKEIGGDRIWAKRAYRLTGYFQNLEPDAEDTDYWALEHGYAAITPIQPRHDGECHGIGRADH